MGGARLDQEALLVAAVGGSTTPLAAEVGMIIGRSGGGCVEQRGADLWATFPSTDTAVDAARAARRATLGSGLSIAVHSAPAVPMVDGARDVAARVLEAANPGQILLSGPAREALGDGAGGLVDFGVHQLAELIDPVRLFGLVEEWALGTTRPPRARRLRLGELPAAMGPLVGRQVEQDEVEGLVATTRLVTLTGVGGIGKTRLAIEVARRFERRMRDGVWLARLETCRSDGDVVTTLLGAAGIDACGAAGRGSDALVDGLRHREALVVVDNCEHVLDAVGEIVTRVLATCGDVRVLATSRAPLGLEGEHVHRVPPLDTVVGGAAVRLFVERASAAGAALDPARDRDELAAICRRVDGIPLAVELAAARCRSMRPVDLLTHLDDLLEVLESDRRDSPERHRTMEAALQWSYDLLPGPEQLVLARSSVFAGPFALDAASAVCAGGSVAADDVPALLDHLLARSLVVPIETITGSRYRLLEPVRRFAADRLTAGDGAATRDRHLTWFVELMAALGARWRAGDDQGASRAAGDDLANLGAAFDRLVEARRIDEAERFAVDAFGPVDIHGEPIAEADWAPRALAIDPDHVGPSTASACAIAAWLIVEGGDPARNAAWIRRGEAAIRQGSVDDGLFVASALHQLRLGAEPATTTGFIPSCVAAALASDDLHRRVWVAAYTSQAEVAIDAADRLGNVMLRALARSTLARNLMDAGQGDTAAGRDAIESFWETAQESNCRVMANHAGQMFGDAHIRSGAVVDGLLLQRAPLRDWCLSGDVRAWDVLRSIATGLAAAGDPVGAARILGALGDRRAVFSTAGTVAATEARIVAALPDDVRRRHERAGEHLGLGAVVAEAVERVDALARRTTAASDAAGSVLTPRQREIADLVAAGLTNKQIASTLAISRLTVETHVRNILERLGALSRAQIAAWAVTAARTTRT